MIWWSYIYSHMGMFLHYSTYKKIMVILRTFLYGVTHGMTLVPYSKNIVTSRFQWSDYLGIIGFSPFLEFLLVLRSSLTILMISVLVISFAAGDGWAGWQYGMLSSGICCTTAAISSWTIILSCAAVYFSNSTVTLLLKYVAARVKYLQNFFLVFLPMSLFLHFVHWLMNTPVLWMFL